MKIPFNESSITWLCEKLQRLENICLDRFLIPNLVNAEETVIIVT